MKETTPTLANDLIRLAEHGATPIDPKATAVRVVADTRVVGLERYRDQPSRLRRVAQFNVGPEFCGYCNTYAGQESAGFASVRPLIVRYWLDYGGPNAPRWGTHQAHFTPAHSPQWQIWAAHHRKPMTHAEFAAFIEERLLDFYQPDGATLLEISQQLDIAGSVSFSSAQRLQSGDVQLQYSTETRGATRAGGAQIPTHFAINVPVYEFHEPVRFNARLRYRLRDGAISLWYEFERLDEVLAAHDMTLLEQIRAVVPRIVLGHVASSAQPAD